MYIIVYIVYKMMYVEYAELYTFFEKFCTLTIQNRVHS